MTGPIVWLASYPKSGNTWLRAVYTALQSRGEPDINRLYGPAPALRTLFDQALSVRSADLTPEEVDALRPRADDVTASLAVVGAFRKIHDGLYRNSNGELIVSEAASKAAIYILRDPRDVAVSWAHHADVPLGVAVDGLCSSRAALASDTKRLEDQVRQRLGTWSEHVLSWSEHAPFPVYIVRYEDCLADPVTSFYKALTFVGVEMTLEDAVRAVEEASFARLSAQEAARGFRERQSSVNPFFRSGSSGGWKKEMPVELADKLFDVNGTVMARYGYVP